MAKEEKFPIDQLRKHCEELFGVSQIIFDGAFFCAQGEFTKEEAAKRITEWLGKEAQ